MNKTVNKLLLAGDTFMSEVHLKHPGLTYSACGPFTKYHTRINIIQKFRKTANQSISIRKS